MLSKRDEIGREPATHSSAQYVSKKTKTDQKLPPVLTPLSANERKRSADEHNTGPALIPSAKKTKPTPNNTSTNSKKPLTTASKSYGFKSTLVPRGTRKKASIGHKDESLLRMVCDCSTTNRVTELHFRKIPHSMIDWNSAHHISKINAWRNQIYGRAGLKARSVSLWYEKEELWFELYFQLCIVESRKRGFLIPGSRKVRDAFNATFVGTIIQDKAGNDLPPRAAREANAFASKFNRMCPVLRARLNNCVFGNSGDTYMPKITFKMMEEYKTMKEEMAAKGVECESEYADHLEDWRHFLSHLPDPEDAEMQEVATEEDDVKKMEAKEVDAVTALISLSHSPITSQIALSPTSGVSCSIEINNEHATPELTCSTRTSFSHAEESFCTPPQPVHAFEGRIYNPDGIYGCDNGTVHECKQPSVAGPSIETRAVEDHI
ncbi:hypothetical protein AA0112_g2347 [Alternaria arborescens]|nr:hypothetical protein AA0112_g2347 [Alternaria arborescens]